MEGGLLRARLWHPHRIMQMGWVDQNSSSIFACEEQNLGRVQNKHQHCLKFWRGSSMLERSGAVHWRKHVDSMFYGFHHYHVNFIGIIFLLPHNSDDAERHFVDPERLSVQHVGQNLCVSSASDVSDLEVMRERLSQVNKFRAHSSMGINHVLRWWMRHECSSANQELFGLNSEETSIKKSN